MQPSVVDFLKENYLNLMIQIGTLFVLAGEKRARHARTGDPFLLVTLEFFVVLVIQYMEEFYGRMETHSYVRNFLCAGSYFLYPLMLIQIIRPLMREKKHVRLLLIPFWLNTLHCLLILFNHPIGVHFTQSNHFLRGIVGFLPFLVSDFYLGLLLWQAYLYFREKNRNAIYLLIFIVLSLLLSSLLELMESVHALNTMSLVDMLLFGMYRTLTSRMQVENEKIRLEMQLYHSQIQPHFIYNSLAAIRSYLPEKSEAREVLNHFSGFLRGSIDMLAESDTIPAEKEFSTVDNYLYMVQKRYGERLKVTTDIQDQDFEMPAFTVQTLVENAIHHGIRDNPDDEIVLQLRSYETQQEHVVQVQDNGAGFEVSVFQEDEVSDIRKGERSHIGLRSIKRRLEILSDGILEIESTPGEGTAARIRIPKNPEKTQIAKMVKMPYT